MRFFSLGPGIGGALLALLCGLAAMLPTPPGGPLAGPLALAGSAGALLALASLWQLGRAIRRAAHVCEAASRGELEARILELPMAGGFGRLQRGINALLDVADAFVREAQGSMVQASQGRFHRRVLLRGLPGSFAIAAEGLNGATSLMAGTHARLRETAAAVAGAAGEISAGSTDLSGRTEAQAAALEQTAAALQQLATTIRSNAENARRADAVALAARGAADDGGTVVTRAVAAMQHIEASSGRMADVIGMIDALAHQTSLLALNASVEAARAGEAGRGFAVVASEVRSLAQRSGSASKEIKALIQQSGREVQEGVGLVQQAGASLQAILGSVQDLAGLVSDIAQASAEQAEGVEQVNQAVASMDEMTQGNAALAEQSAAAARSLEERAQDLTGMMQAGAAQAA